MKKIYLTMLAALSFVTTLFGQVRYADLTGSHTGKMKYAAGKNAYLMDEYKLDYTYKIVMGDPVCVSNVSWTRNNSFTVNKKTVNYAKLANYEDLKMRFDRLVPDSAVFTYTMLFYSEQSKCFIASAKTSVTVPYIERAGITEGLEIPQTLSWLNSFSDVVIGKQTKEKPGVVIADAALEKSFEADRLKSGKLNKSERGFGFRFRRIFERTSKIELVNVSVNIKWNDANYDYIADELTRRENFSKHFASGNREKAIESYFSNRKYSIAVNNDSHLFWNTTVRPTNVWMDAVTEGDKLYAAKRYDESSVYYQIAVNAAPDFVYPAARLAKIKDFKNHKNNRNVGTIELIYIEGGNGVKPFYMSKTEVTQSQWRRVMGTSPSANKGRDLPVENVSWEDAIAFVKELNRETGMNYRLPKKVEWEYAAKGGNKGASTEYAGGNNLYDIAWCAYNSGEQTHEVATKSPNEVGLYDMTGNVGEWVVDQYDKVTRFVKGGSWADDASGCTISGDEKVNAKYKSNRIGFRLCQDE